MGQRQQVEAWTAPAGGPTQDQAQKILNGRSRVLEQIASGVPLADVLLTLVQSIEQVKVELHCTVLLLDEHGCLRLGAAPSMAAFYNEAVDGLAAGVGVGSCGTAAATGRRVLVEDVSTHPYWEAYRDLAARAGVSACWSDPILAIDGSVLGTIAMYTAEPGLPDEVESELLMVASQLAGIAIQRDRSLEKARLSELRLRQVIDVLPHMIFAKDRNGRFLLANQAVASAYGTSVEALLGRDQASLHAHSAELQRMLADDRSVIDSGQIKVIAEETFTDEAGQSHVLETTKIPFQFDREGERSVLGIAVDITKLKQNEERIRKNEDQLRALASELVLTEERERHNLAVDLHDGFLQTLAVARFKLGSLRGAVETAGLTDSFLEVTDLIDEVLRAARSLTFEMSPAILHDMGLAPALAWLVDDVEKRYDLPVVLANADASLEPLDERLRVTLFRSVRELLINVAKHAEASEAQVRLVRSPTSVTITVSDEGRGFDPCSVGPTPGGGGFGLFSIRERLQHLGGSVTVDSSPESGTRVTLSAPLDLE